MNLPLKPKEIKKGFILVKKLKRPVNQTKAGIIMPESAEKLSLYQRCEVVMVGADHEEYKMETKAGDEVLVLASHVELDTRTIKINGEPHFIIREESGYYCKI